MGLSFLNWIMAYQQNISAAPITIPGVIASDCIIQTNNSSGGYDHMIQINPIILKGMGMEIVRKEMALLKTQEPEWDLVKMGEMAFSSDKEMVELFFTLIDKYYTRYTRRVITAINNNNNYGLDNVIREYMEANMKNLTDNIL